MPRKTLITSTVLFLAIAAGSILGARYFRSAPSEYLLGRVIKSTAVQPVSAAAGPSSGTEVQAWIYPGAPACDAKAEYSDGRDIDILKPEYFSIDDDGSLQLLTEAKAGCNGYSAKNLGDLKKYSARQYVTISSSYSGSTELFLEDALSGGTSVATLVNFAKANNVEGIELDFEDFGSWSPETYERYKDFVLLLGNALHASNKKLMIDGPAIANASEQAWFVWRYEDFVALPVDKIVVMAYDYQYDHGAGTPVAPLSWIKGVSAWTLAKYPFPDRVTIGIPSYGYRGIAGRYDMRILTYTQLSKEPNFTKAKRDAASQEMTWKNGTTVYFYQDAESMRQKVQVLEAAGIKSVSVWHLGGNRWFSN